MDRRWTGDGPAMDRRWTGDGPAMARRWYASRGPRRQLPGPSLGRRDPARPGRTGPRPAASKAGLGDAHAAALPAAESAALFFGEATPDTGVLRGVERPLQTRLPNRAQSANGFGRFDLCFRGP